ncbi:bifunctional protein-serine/threonine kinase/phosphatase [Alteromonadaceae bacterium BrNp21-10]|nr:bifunctional protein-serine/threonine kinase/phosphatase [Alteromonadaceae bacterium BrNp21-10]
MKKLDLQFGGYSTAGTKAENQDAFAAFQPEGSNLELKGAIAAIADGVSASSKAKLASSTCVTNFIQDYLETPETWSVKRAAARVLTSLNFWCHGQNTTQIGQHSDMLTTFSGAVFKSTTMHIFHVGDSRIYRFQDNSLEQLTRDHKHYQGSTSYLTRAVGIDPHLDVDYKSVELQEGDIFVYTTDGVHEFISDKTISGILKQTNADLEQAARAIITAAEQANSDDNLTCLLVRVNALPAFDIDESFRQLSQQAIPPPLDPGMKLEGYKVLQVIFNGTRSSLYKVVNEEDGKIYGLKTPSENYADDPLYLSGFVHEEWIGQHLKHHSVMRIFPRPANAKFMYHLCEFIDGQTLRQWMVDNPKPSVDQVRGIIQQLIIALRTMQRLDMIHRDLKPENVMINHLGQVKLIDFGTVHVAGLAEKQTHIKDDQPLGSVNYIAPEYLLSNSSSHQSDIFSLGVICYEMLAGKLPYKPFAYKDYQPKSYAEWDYTPLTTARKDLPMWLNLTLRKALQPHPNNRYQAFSEFEADMLKPNENMLKAAQNAPLLEKNPLLFWKLLCGILLLANLVQPLIA